MKLTHDFGPCGLIQRAVLNKVRPTAFAVYAALVTYTDAEGDCFPCYETLAKDIGKDRRTVIRAMAELEAANIVEKKVRKTALKKNTSNFYHVNVIPALKQGGVKNDTQTIDLSIVSSESKSPTPMSQTLGTIAHGLRGVGLYEPRIISKQVLADGTVVIHLGAVSDPCQSTVQTLKPLSNAEIQIGRELGELAHRSASSSGAC